ncbi:Histidine phosphatase superfamily (branch 1) [Chitinophaga costaii]|uniref:Histidine phosphatase superfamily (Branch 1) n=2 Tax=Chitinophaga costaii TaxID=1335309 RepID=A0A1C3Z7H2_9BACT|nr:histidine phosphatase family protein [Chitinophaga costaii]PUZ30259.1 histidine phosphatase family protein [Chitinophaga costaii]SCB78218.1 Histidine phosphatase superfamily (branch 1) [Chitinophaga costaii]
MNILHRITLGSLIAGGLFVLPASCQEPVAERQPIPVSEDSTFLTGTFFLVRHGESFPGYDTTLTPDGQCQAGALARLLRDSAIDKIYFTHFKRAIDTADSLRLALRTDTVFYNADSSGESLLYELTRHNDWGKRILVIGHRPALLPILRSLKATPPVDSVPENAYDELFTVYKKGNTVSCNVKIF